jgi:transcriptional regulator with XRE-family HTH domain
MSGWSKRDVNRLRTKMQEHGRSLDDVASEIRQLTGCSPLAAYRMALGWSQPEAVERCSEQAPASVMDQPLLSRLEQFPAAGSRPPQAAQLTALAAVYGTKPLRLLTPQALERLDERERAVLIRCNAAFTDPTGNPPIQGVVPSAIPTTTPRQRLIPASVDLERQVEMAARKALRFAVTAEASNIGPETLDQLRAEVARLAVAYPVQALPILLSDLIDLQDVAFRLLEGRQRPTVTAELYLLAGALSGMLAKASHDLGDPHSAITQARTAYVCADNAGHDGLRTWIRSLQSMIAYWAGWPNDAVRYARLATETAARSTGTESVWLPAQEARAWAVLGNAEQVQQAIARAADARDRVQGDDLDEFGGIMTFTRQRQLYYAADTQIWLPGAEAQAERSATEAIDAYQAADPAERSFSDEAGAHADLALARVGMGELDGAAHALRPVLDLPPDQRIGGVVASAMRIHEALRAPRFRDASITRNIQLEIEEYAQRPAAAALPRAR